MPIELNPGERLPSTEDSPPDTPTQQTIQLNPGERLPTDTGNEIPVDINTPKLNPGERLPGTKGTPVVPPENIRPELGVEDTQKVKEMIGNYDNLKKPEKDAVEEIIMSAYPVDDFAKFYASGGEHPTLGKLPPTLFEKIVNSAEGVAVDTTVKDTAMVVGIGKLGGVFGLLFTAPKYLDRDPEYTGAVDELTKIGSTMGEAYIYGNMQKIALIPGAKMLPELAAKIVSKIPNFGPRLAELAGRSALAGEAFTSASLVGNIPELLAGSMDLEEYTKDALGSFGYGAVLSNFKGPVKVGLASAGIKLATDIPAMARGEKSGEEAVKEAAMAGIITTGTLAVGQAVLGVQGMYSDIKQAKYQKARADHLKTRLVSAKPVKSTSKEKTPATYVLPEYKPITIKEGKNTRTLTGGEIANIINNPHSPKHGQYSAKVEYEARLRAFTDTPEDGKMLTKLIIGKEAKSRTDYQKFNNRLENMSITGEFSPLQIYTEGGRLALKQAVQREMRLERDPMSDMMSADPFKALKPEHRKFEEYGAKQVKRYADDSAMKDNRIRTAIKNSHDARDRLLPQNEVGWNKSMDKLNVVYMTDSPKTQAEFKAAYKTLTPNEKKWYDINKRKVLVKWRENLIQKKLDQGATEAEVAKYRENPYLPDINLAMQQEKIMDQAMQFGEAASMPKTKITKLTSRYMKAKTDTTPRDQKNVITDLSTTFRLYEAANYRAENFNKTADKINTFLKTHKMNAANKRYIVESITTDLYGSPEHERKVSSEMLVYFSKLPKNKQIALEKMGLMNGNVYKKIMLMPAKAFSAWKIWGFNVPFGIRNVALQGPFSQIFSSAQNVALSHAMTFDPKMSAFADSTSRQVKIQNKLAGRKAEWADNETVAVLSNSNLVKRYFPTKSQQFRKNAVHKFIRAGFWPVEGSARYNVKQGYLAAYTDAREKGFPDLWAQRIGDGRTELTNFLYTYSNRVPLYKGGFGRDFGALVGTWSPSYWSMMRRAMGTKHWGRVLMNQGLVQAMAVGMGQINPYFYSGAPTSLMTKPPINTAILDALNIVQGYGQYVTTGDDTRLNMANYKMKMLLKPGGVVPNLWDGMTKFLFD